MAEIEARLDQYALGYQLPFTLRESDDEGRVISSWAAGPRLGFSRSETEYRGRLASVAFPGISSTTDQEVDENRYRAGAFGGYRRELAPAVVGLVDAYVDLYYRDADLRSRQENLCGAPGCPPANTFTANNRDSDSGVTWGAGFRIGLDYSPCEDSVLGVDLGYSYLGATAALRNPTSTIDFDGPPRLGSEGVSGFRVGLRYQYQF
jgi:hypothetical protein